VRYRGNDYSVPTRHGHHAVKELAGLDRGDDRRCSLADGVARPPDGMSGIGGNDLAGHQPVEEHAKAGEMLLDGGGGAFPLHLFDVSCDMNRLDVA
jgi:hypothetical protein